MAALVRPIVEVADSAEAAVRRFVLVIRVVLRISAALARPHSTKPRDTSAGALTRFDKYRLHVSVAGVH